MKNVVEIGVDGNKLVERRVNIGEVLKIGLEKKSQAKKAIFFLVLILLTAVVLIPT